MWNLIHTKIALCTVLGSVDVTWYIYDCLKDTIIELLLFILWCLFYCVHFIVFAVIVY